MTRKEAKAKIPRLYFPISANAKNRTEATVSMEYGTSGIEVTIHYSPDNKAQYQAHICYYEHKDGKLLFIKKKNIFRALRDTVIRDAQAFWLKMATNKLLKAEKHKSYGL